MPDETDPHPKGPGRFVGRAVSFNDPGNAARRLVGMVTAARYIGRTVRGQLPDYEITVRGKSGKALTVSLVESRASFPDS